MKKLIVFAAAAMIASFSFAGKACCPFSAAAKKKADTEKQAQVKSSEDCLKVLASLELTDEQQKKLAALKSDCEGMKCDISASKKMMVGVKELLTPEQLAACKEKCTAAKIDCPMLEKETKEKKAI